MSGYYLNPLSAQELLLAQSIIIKNETTVEYIRMWFDSMLDVLCDTLEKDSYIVDLGSMIYDIAVKSKVKHGLFRYSNKETIIRYAVNPDKHTVKVDLYMFDDALKVALAAIIQSSDLNSERELPLEVFGMAFSRIHTLSVM